MLNRKIIVTLGLSSIVTLVALTSMAPQQEEGFKNLKVLPKNIQHEQLGKVMHEWSNSLGVHCDFCHAPNAAGKGLDFASDAKPEKEMARHMYKMMNSINEKYFEAKKDSLGMMMKSGINCYTCHRGDSHPEVVAPPSMMKGPAGPPPGAPATTPPPPPANPGTTPPPSN
jgi:hypothetical protein